MCGVGFLEKMEFWKMEKVMVCGGRKEIKEKEKWKRNYNEKIFLLEWKMKIMEVADSRVSIADTEILRENTRIVRNSSVSERLEIIIKNQEY